MSAAADKAVVYLLTRIKDDPRVAYHFLLTESLALLTAAYAEAQGLDVETFRKEYVAGLRTEAPFCHECRARVDAAQGAAP